MRDCDRLPPAVYAQLLEDVAHVRPDRLEADRELLGDLLLRQALSRQRQHLELACGQTVLGLAVASSRRACRRQTAGKGADARDELARIEGLAQVIVAAEFQACDLVVAFGAAARDEDDPDAESVALAQAPADVVARHQWQMDVEQDDPWLLAPRRRERDLAACRRTAEVSGFGQHTLGERGEARVIVHDQDAAVVTHPASRSGVMPPRESSSDAGRIAGSLCGRRAIDSVTDSPVAL